MGAVAAAQLALLTGHYRCANCGDMACEHVRKARRWWLCDACWAGIVTPWQQASADGNATGWLATTDAQRAALDGYWAWARRMEQRYPVPPHTVQRSGRAAPTLTADECNPYCACGREREASAFRSGGGLFGGPFHRLCPVCDAKAGVDALASLAQATRPHWDDEDWLDHLYKQYPRYFELGVLPDYWFEVRGK